MNCQVGSSHHTIAIILHDDLQYSKENLSTFHSNRTAPESRLLASKTRIGHLAAEAGQRLEHVVDTTSWQAAIGMPANHGTCDEPLARAIDSEPRAESPTSVETERRTGGELASRKD